MSRSGSVRLLTCMFLVGKFAYSGNPLVMVFVLGLNMVSKNDSFRTFFVIV